MGCGCFRRDQLQGLPGLAVSLLRSAAVRSAAAQIGCHRRHPIADEAADAVDCPPYPVALIVALRSQAQHPGCFGDAP